MQAISEDEDLAVSQVTQSQRAKHHLTSEEVDAVMETFANKDDPSKMTWSRIIVSNYLSPYLWYNPSQTYKNPPSLKKAYAYYEHITLPRHFTGEHHSDHVMRRAEPGESVEATELYPPTTPSSSLIEWGIGVDLYFSTVRFMAWILLAAGLLHLPVARYYAGTDYSPEGNDGLHLFLKGTAVCMSGEWAACENDELCNPKDWNATEASRSRYATASDGTPLVYRNTCDGGNYGHAFVNWVCLFFLIVMIALVSFYLRAREVRFDEDKLTSTDYSIVVKNPPPDALDPDEWHSFFSQFTSEKGQVTAVTIALNNEELLKKLIYRRVHKNHLRMKLPKGIDMEDEDVVRSAVAQLVKERDSEPRGCLRKIFDCTILPILNLIGMFLPAETLVDKVYELEDEIKELQKEKYDATKVYVTFETEEDQRAALEGMAVGRLDIMMNNTSSLPPSTVFQNSVLKVVEPPEPSSVRWLDLSAGATRRIIWRVINFCITIGIVASAGAMVSAVRYSDAGGAQSSAVLVSIFNFLIPVVVKILMILERHHTEGSFQTSLYLKITLFRWVNTALLIKVLTPFTNTILDRKQDAIRQITGIMLNEMWLTPGLRLLDIVSNLKKHVLAPRSRTQEEMNLNFQGTPYSLGERYTDLTKVLFVCFFYSALMPVTFFFGAGILFVQYYADKYCLTRIWSVAPFLGSELARFSRRYFFSGALLSYAVVSAYTWAQFPYDNVCDPDDPKTGVDTDYENVIDLNGLDLGTVQVKFEDTVVFCSQQWTNFDGFVFPPRSDVQPAGKEWMTEDQERLVDVYGWTACALLIGFIVIFFGSAIYNFVLSWFQGVYDPDGQDQHIDFSANTEIFGYVPQIRWPGFPFPFLACDVDMIDQGLIGWNDPARSYDHYNLMFDVPYDGMPRKTIINENTRTTTRISNQEEFHANSRRLINQFREESKRTHLSARPIFSIIKDYPPEWATKLADTTDEN